MAKGVHLKHDIPLTLISLKRVEKQLPFAVALSLTKTAQDVQRFEVDKQLPSKLTIRNRWAERGRFAVKISKATKQNPEASVFSRAPWLELVERGGVKRPENRKLIIPKVGNAARPSPTRKVVRRMKPRRGDQRKIRKPFFHPKLNGVFRVRGRGRKKRLELLWSTARKARVRAQLQFEEAGAQHAVKVYPRHFTDAFRIATRTAF